MAQATKPKQEDRTIAVNRKASHDYELLDRYEAGIVLTGTEIKSIREGRINVREAYARIQNGELYLLNCHIAQYQAGSYQNHEPTRPRRLDGLLKIVATSAQSPSRTAPEATTSGIMSRS